MWEVYRAEDTRLGQTVASKVLPAELAQDKDRLHRFVREARTASALSHANLAHFYDIGLSGGRHFIAVGYVEGRSLAQKTSGRPQELREILEIGIEAADALAETRERQKDGLPRKKESLQSKLFPQSTSRVAAHTGRE